jgi:hypothetical protein
MALQPGGRSSGRSEDGLQIAQPERRWLQLADLMAEPVAPLLKSVVIGVPVVAGQDHEVHIGLGLTSQRPWEL